MKFSVWEVSGRGTPTTSIRKVGTRSTIVLAVDLVSRLPSARYEIWVDTADPSQVRCVAILMPTEEEVEDTVTMERAYERSCN
jgi:hypothetical protein